MTSLTLTPDAAPVTAPQGTANQLTFGRVLHSEWRKLFWLRSVLWCSLLLIVLSWASGAGISLLALDDGSRPEMTGLLIIQAANGAWLFLAILMALLGIFSITSEYGSGMIRSTASVVPQRNLLFTAKLVAVIALSLVVTVVAVAGTAVIAAVIANPTAIGAVLSAPVLGSLAITVVTLVLTAVGGYALGQLLRASSGAITIMLAVLFAAPMALGIIGMIGQEWAFTVSDWLPSVLAACAVIGPIESALNPAVPLTETWIALGAFAVWIVALIIPAMFAYRSRAIV